MQYKRKTEEVCVADFLPRSIFYCKMPLPNKFGSDIFFAENLARFKVDPSERIAFCKYARMGGIFFGNGNGTAVYVQAIFPLFECGHVKMSVEQQIALIRQCGRVVSVRCDRRAPAQFEQEKIRPYGKIKHHLIYFAVAVALNADDGSFQFV